MIDLHVHSTKSDGSFTPGQLVDYALEKGVSAIALTDHDTVAGIEDALAAAKDKPVEVIPGIELSTEYQKKDVHLLGLYINYTDSAFVAQLSTFTESRDARNQKLCLKLQEHGVNITYEQLGERFPNAVLTRAHFATIILERGYVRSRNEAFERYVGDRAPCYLPRKRITPVQGISLILAAGGIPILAHPMLYHMSRERLETLIVELKAAGLAGIEGIYPTHLAAEERIVRALAKKYHLLISGGTDFHGTTKPNLDMGTGYGNFSVPEEVLNTLKQYHRRTVHE